MADVARAALLAAGQRVAEDLGEYRVCPGPFLELVADELGLHEPTVSVLETVAPIDYGVWLDDPPRLTLQRWYLDRLRELPLSHVAVMVDGPEPGLGDARWDAVALAELASALRDVRRTLTVWTAADREATAELHERLPGLVHALGASAVEADAEPVGEWAIRRVTGYRDEGGARGALDEAAVDVAAAMLACGVDVEVTVFPGALRHARVLLEDLARQAGPQQAVRLLVQAYPVRHRGRDVVPWDGPLGPLRLPGESIQRARRAVPAGVEVCCGRAVYDTTWPDGRDGLEPGTRAAVRAGARVVRDWSAKWLCRRVGRDDRHAERRERVLRVHEAVLDAVRDSA